VLAVLPALAIPLMAIAMSNGEETRIATAATPSFTKDVAPIVAAKCAGCHQAGGIAPFALRTARQISSRAAVIEAAVESRRMPPWPPGPRSPAFVGQADRTLTARERATIVAWARAGGPVDGSARRPPPQATVPVRAGESVLDLRMPAAYGPQAAKGATDDYRCFLLDPKLSQDASVTSARIVPGQPKVVHHVILFRVPQAQVAAAKRLDGADRGAGWSCFGDTGLSLGDAGSIQDSLDDADWVSAWAPGWGAGRLPDGTGVPLPARSQIVMQVHYNLLNGRAPDRSRAILTVAPSSAGLAPLRTMLLPGPVELACAREEQGRLCDRTEALFDLARKYGASAGFVPAGLLLLCGRSASSPQPSAVSSCDRRISAPSTIHVVAGHMHLLGASIRLTLNPGTARERILLDIPRWDFHWQNAYALSRPVRAEAGDVIRVTCRHDVGKRRRGEHRIPKTPRYVLWGEGTTDEMCLGIVQVTRG
jgi:mono/diheme cytochrome c family protein